MMTTAWNGHMAGATQASCDMPFDGVPKSLAALMRQVLAEANSSTAKTAQHGMEQPVCLYPW